jgi:methionyl-tRNA formyltransferase
MRIVFIGAVAFSQACLQRLVELKADLVGVVTVPAAKPLGADRTSLAALCAAAGLPCRETADVNEAATVAWIRARRPDIIFCFGWSRLLGPALLSSAPLGVVGYHPALLPRNRGRHPLIWALALGLSETGSTFFLMDEGPDTGNIVSQDVIAIDPQDDAASLYEKMTRIALGQLERLLPQVAAGTMERRRQEAAVGTAWRKRSAADGRIDWRMPTAGIRNLVRALTRPYPGATAILAGTEFIVWQTGPAAPAPPDIEPGKVLEVAASAFAVKTGDGTILVTEHTLAHLPRVGDYL